MAKLHIHGLDLMTGLAVEAGDRETWEWKLKGYTGDGTLVCLECYLGADRPDGPRTVPLVPRGKIGGARQPHFAHPPGMAPPGDHHSREGAWRSQTKHRLERWTIVQGGTGWIEARAADGRRRARRVRLRVQSSPVSSPKKRCHTRRSQPATARAQARGARFLDRQIRQIEGQLAELKNRLRILRMQRALLPKPPGP